MLSLGGDDQPLASNAMLIQTSSDQDEDTKYGLLDEEIDDLEAIFKEIDTNFDSEIMPIELKQYL